MNLRVDRMPSRHSRCDITYVGTGSLQNAAQAVADASSKAGMLCDFRTIGPGQLQVAAVQGAPWHRVVTLALPQKVTWRLEAWGTGQLTAHAEFLPFRWYFAVLSGACLFVALCLSGVWLATSNAPAVPSGLAAALRWLIWPAMFLAFVNVRLLGALGGGRQAEALWSEVVARMENYGGVFEPRGLPVSFVFAASVLSYAVLFLAAGVWMLSSFWLAEPVGSSRLPELLTVLVAFALVLFVGAVLMLGRLTLVGDAFVLVLQDSWRYETRADRATQEMGIDPRILLRCLRRIRRACTISAMGAGRLPASTIEPLGIGTRPIGGSLIERWRRAWRLFCRQYFDAIDLDYWHPAYRDRAEALQKASAEVSHEAPALIPSRAPIDNGEPGA